MRALYRCRRRVRVAEERWRRTEEQVLDRHAGILPSVTNFFTSLCSGLFGTSGACSGCGQMIPANDYVMRAAQNVYHVKCFACVKCHSQLVPGDRYNLVNGNVLCEQDCLKMLKGSPATVRKGKVRAAIKV
ncbi:hypothetical protein HPB51_013276 [Rhipicephalus microplus]|uniref:LIM zinc-binding domain-containing protein n=1 Tax=Rhipicephalus microplus TaxID=6941 RepID=A0A9J6EG98_RHIMP|nr:hypothetical protein HPB51_013276 [Rhipicephalus microplus]